MRLEAPDLREGRRDGLTHARERQAERGNRALEPLHEVDAHEAADALLAALHGDVLAEELRLCRVGAAPAGLDEMRRRIDGERERHDLIVDLLIGDVAWEARDGRPLCDGLPARRETADAAHVVVFLDVAAGAGDGDAVEQAEEVEAQTTQQGLCRARFRRLFAPVTIGTLHLREDFPYARLGREFPVYIRGVPLVGQRELVLEVAETVVDRRRREHEHLRLDAALHDVVQETQVAVLPAAVDVAVAVAEVVRLVDDDEVVVLPVETREVDAVRCAVIAREVGMEEHGIVQAVGGNGIVLVVVAVGVPVLRELFRAEDEDGLIALLVVFDDG